MRCSREQPTHRWLIWSLSEWPPSAFATPLFAASTARLDCLYLRGHRTNNLHSRSGGLFLEHSQTDIMEFKACRSYSWARPREAGADSQEGPNGICVFEPEPGSRCTPQSRKSHPKLSCPLATSLAFWPPASSEAEPSNTTERSMEKDSSAALRKRSALG